MPKPIAVADAQALRKSLKNVLDKYKSKEVVDGHGKVRGRYRRIQADEYEFVLKTIMKKIADLTA